MAEKCMCEGPGTLIFACSGGSNVGQMSNEAAVSLTKGDKGKLSCLAGIGGHVSGIVESAKAACRIVAIDGCPVACTKKALEHAGLSPGVHVVITELGIEKSHDLELEEGEVEEVIKKVSEMVG